MNSKLPPSFKVRRSFSPSLIRFEQRSLYSEKGQIVVEYVLLLIVAVALATVIVKTVVERDPDNPGFLVQKWTDIQRAIGSDDPGDRSK